MLAQEHDNTRCNDGTLITAGPFVDGSSLHTVSEIPITNAERLQKAFERVIAWADQNGLKIDIDKVDYICFIRLHKKILPIPPESTTRRQMRTYERQPHIKWLGIIFDSKLSFRQHVRHLASRGAAAAGCLQMLANTTSGLSHQNNNACVLPALSYASLVWWPGNNGQIRKIESSSAKQMPQNNDDKITKGTPMKIEEITPTHNPTMASLCTREATHTKADNKPRPQGYHQRGSS